MSDVANILIDQALELPASERAIVAEQLLISLEQPNSDLDTIWASEVESRLASYHSGETEAVPLSEVVGATHRE
jgi:putative addiction module component (TIGR02574 family)